MRQLGRYTIIEPLGEGGMATVYRAFDPRFEREVALKALPRASSQDPMFRARFKREAKTLAALEHPAIVPVHDFGEEQEQPFLVMRLMVGGSLASRAAGRKLSLADAARILQPLAPALDYAHAQGVIHRDLKPANILFDRFGNPHLSDFGIVKLLGGDSAGLTGTSGILGTPAYMSPEQARGLAELTGRSDQYALGVILFEMLSGRVPFEADTPIGTAMMHVLNPLPNILQVRPDVPAAVQTILNRVLAKDPADRYPTAVAFTTALHGLVQQQASGGAREPARSAAAATTIAEPFEGPDAATVIEPFTGGVLKRTTPAEGPAPPRKQRNLALVALAVVAVVALLACFFSLAVWYGRTQELSAGLEQDEGTPAGNMSLNGAGAGVKTRSTTAEAEAQAGGATGMKTSESPTPEAVPTVAPPKDLIICMAQEPETLYLYRTSMASQVAITHGFYESMYTDLSYGYQAAGLEKLPSLADGDAAVNSVPVRAGDQVVDANGDVVALEEGVQVVTSERQEETYSNGTLLLDQLTAHFTFKPWVWQDGTPVTSDDSIYAFELADDPDSFYGRWYTQRTESYVATDSLSVRWTGLPGFIDANFPLNVWQPLPRHAWSGFTAAELHTASESNVTPLSNGPFKIESWTAGDSIYMTPNEHYYRADEGLPRLNSVTFKFIPDTDELFAGLLRGECDIATSDGMGSYNYDALLDAQEQGIITPYFAMGTGYEHISFGIQPAEFYAETRPDWFEDTRVRQAMTLCTDRQGMIDDVLHGQSQILNSYVSSDHPLYAAGTREWPYDVQAGNRLLNEAGFIDSDADGVREYYAAGVAGGDPAWDGTPFSVTLGTTTGSEERRQLTTYFKENMRDCGIEVEVFFVPASQLFAPGPDGLLYGRKFDLGQFALLGGTTPSCSNYRTANIPGLNNEEAPLWAGSNNAGWSNAAFDAACKTAMSTLPNTPDNVAQHKEAQRIFSEELPIIPLFVRTRVAAARPEVCNFGVDATQTSELYNLFEIGFANCD